MTFIKISKLKNLFAYKSNASIYNQVRSGVLPKPIQISSRSVCWSMHEINLILEARAAGLDENYIKNLVLQIHKSRLDKAQFIKNQRFNTKPKTLTSFRADVKGESNE